MVALFAPVDAISDKSPARWRTHAELPEEATTCPGQRVVDVVAITGALVPAGPYGHEAPVATLKVVVIDHGLHQVDSEPSGQMVITGARSAQRLGSGALSQRLDRRDRRQLLQRLDQVPDGWSRQAVVAVPTVRLNLQQPSVRELTQVSARGSAADAGLSGQPAGRQCPTVIEGEQHGTASSIGHHRSERSDIGIPVAVLHGHVPFAAGAVRSPRRRAYRRASSICVESICAYRWPVSSERICDITDPSARPTHVRIRPKILYFGTPVALVTTLNPDGSANIGPMSSAWALGDTVVLGWSTSAQTTTNLRRELECVINLPDASLHHEVEALADMTGAQPVPPHKAGSFHYEQDKFAAAGWTQQPSVLVAPPRIAECALQLEATVAAVHRPAGPDRDHFVIVETHVEYVHGHPDIVVPGTDHIDPNRWTPLLYVFRHYFGTGPDLGATFRAEY